MLRYRFPVQELVWLLVAACWFCCVGDARAETVSATQISSPEQLLSGSYADGQVGDYLLQNDRIAVVISAIGHAHYYAESGGNIIDAGSAIQRIDALAVFYTYFDAEWPRQAVYTTLAIVDDGSGGGPAIVRVSGVDSYDPSLAVATEYSLAADAAHVVITSTLTRTGGGTLHQFEVGDAFAWGTCNTFAPGYGFQVDGTTNQPWLAGTAGGVSYGYAGVYGDCWGPHGGSWSDVNVTTVTIPAGGSADYQRFLTVAGGDVAAVASVLHEALGMAVGWAAGEVIDADTLEPLPGASILAFDAADNVYVNLVTDALGQASCSVPPGDWRLRASAPLHLADEVWITVSEGDSTTFALALPGDGMTIPAIGDTLTVIQRPLLNIPAIVTPGDTLVIECAADPATSGWSAALGFGDLVLPLSLVDTAYDPAAAWWRLSAVLPTVPVYELYNLQVAASGGPDAPLFDATRNAVRVIGERRQDFYFVHFTDTHLPTKLYVDQPGADTDTSEVVDMREVLADVAVINPEFILLTGDFVNEGELEDYLGRRVYTRGQRLLTESAVPVYLIAGNHDIGGWIDTPPPDGTARRDWWRFFGWSRLDNPPPGAPWRTQNYSFDYGPVHFIALESYDNYDLWREEFYGAESFTAPQLQWLADDLAVNPGAAATVLFYHFDFQHELNLGGLGVDMALWGHVHGDRGNINHHPYDLATNNVCNGARSFRLVRYQDGELQPQPTLSAGGDGNTLHVSYAPANDGTAAAITATVVNNHPEDFEHGQLKFLLAPGEGSIDVTGGTLLQTLDTEAATLCYVGVPLQAGSTHTVTVERDLTPVEFVPEVPAALQLAQNHPNPFNPATHLSFGLPSTGHVRLAIFDLRGSELAVLVDESLPAGEHRVLWDGRDRRGLPVASGPYMARLEAGGEVQARKILLAR